MYGNDPGGSFQGDAPFPDINWVCLTQILGMKIAPKLSLPGGLEPPTFRLTVERANQLRHGSTRIGKFPYDV